MMRCTCVVYVWQKGASVIRENTNWRAPEMLCLRRPLVRDWKLYASSPAGRSGGSLIFGTRCLTATPPPGLPTVPPHRHFTARDGPHAGHIAPKQNASRPTNRECIDSEKYAPASFRAHPVL